MQKNIVRIALSFLFIFGLNITAQAQMERFIHYIGPGYFTDTEFENLDMLGLYNPRFNIVEMSEKSSISLGSYMHYLYQSENFNGVKSTSSSMYLPLVAEVNFGRHATHTANNRFGFFAGGV